MNKIQSDEQLAAILQKLRTKFEADGQDLNSYLEGMTHNQYLNYWDYIQLDTLLSLQKPKTNFPDEFIFVVYHQIAELYFKLILFDINQVLTEKDISSSFVLEKMIRINHYFNQLLISFEHIIGSISKSQFGQFRTSLMPASGFQSCQFREIELNTTPIVHLVDNEYRNADAGVDIQDLYHHLYWKKGSIDSKTGKKTLTLVQFEEKYDAYLLSEATKFQTLNLWTIFEQLKQKETISEALKEAYKTFDLNMNVHWALIHFKAAAKHLSKKPVDMTSTGGTNWQQYLPPRFQKIVFFPELWSKEEIDNWGKAYIESALAPQE